jgi:hypothetical protein
MKNKRSCVILINLKKLIFLLVIKTRYLNLDYYTLITMPNNRTRKLRAKKQAENKPAASNGVQSLKKPDDVIRLTQEELNRSVAGMLKNIAEQYRREGKEFDLKGVELRVRSTNTGKTILLPVESIIPYM